MSDKFAELVKHILGHATWLKKNHDGDSIAIDAVLLPLQKMGDVMWDSEKGFVFHAVIAEEYKYSPTGGGVRTYTLQQMLQKVIDEGVRDA